MGAKTAGSSLCGPRAFCDSTAPQHVYAVLPPKWEELHSEAAGPAGEAQGAAVSEARQKGAADEGTEAAWGATPGREEEDAATEGEDEGDAEVVEEEEDLAPVSSMASLLFYGVRGRQMREGEAPSWFNPVEASRAGMVRVRAFVWVGKGLGFGGRPGQATGCWFPRCACHVCHACSVGSREQLSHDLPDPKA